jgi:dipicolinate synthase subunit A
MNIAIIGGDMRQACLAELFAADGHQITAFGLEEAGQLKGVELKNLTDRSYSGYDCYVLPLPVTAQDGLLNTPLTHTDITADSLLRSLPRGSYVCGGRIDEEYIKLCRELNLPAFDYFKREELAVANAAITAEGAIQIAMEETGIAISHARVLVIGFGRVGKLLANRLHALGALVTVSARKLSDMAWIEALGYKAANTLSLDGILSGFDIIFNTVPARVLGSERLKHVSPSCLCIELASAPGGMDFTAASRLGLKSIWALSLPGRVAPITAGSIIRNTIYNILREEGFSI